MRQEGEGSGRGVGTSQGKACLEAGRSKGLKKRLQFPLQDCALCLRRAGAGTQEVWRTLEWPIPLREVCKQGDEHSWEPVD